MNKKIFAILIVFSFGLTLFTGAAAQTLQFGERELKIGDRGEDVAVLQQFLNDNNYREGRIDGVFGPLTYGSLIEFQKDHNLKADGILGGETLEKIMEMLDKEPLDKTEEVKNTEAMPQTMMAFSEIHLTAADFDLFARLVHAESAGEPFEGQVAVAATVLNRLKSDLYPNTISGIIYQVESGRYQYSPVLDGRINLPAGESAKRAVREALKGWDPSAGATGFYNPAKTSNAWVRSHPVTTTIGSHVFFKY
ncbi:MAG: spore cortex-lytic enzyme [Firmicutes bacterium]|nr:spore cortex-lytic enzyme [Bacillota bacterium]